MRCHMWFHNYSARVHLLQEIPQTWVNFWWCIIHGEFFAAAADFLQASGFTHYNINLVMIKVSFEKLLQLYGFQISSNKTRWMKGENPSIESLRRNRKPSQMSASLIISANRDCDLMGTDIICKMYAIMPLTARITELLSYDYCSPILSWCVGSNEMTTGVHYLYIT